MLSVLFARNTHGPAKDNSMLLVDALETGLESSVERIATLHAVTKRGAQRVLTMTCGRAFTSCIFVLEACCYARTDSASNRSPGNSLEPDLNCHSFSLQVCIFGVCSRTSDILGIFITTFGTSGASGAGPLACEPDVPSTLPSSPSSPGSGTTIGAGIGAGIGKAAAG